MDKLCERTYFDLASSPHALRKIHENKVEELESLRWQVPRNIFLCGEIESAALKLLVIILSL